MYFFLCGDRAIFWPGFEGYFLNSVQGKRNCVDIFKLLLVNITKATYLSECQKGVLWYCSQETDTTPTYSTRSLTDCRTHKSNITTGLPLTYVRVHSLSTQALLQKFLIKLLFSTNLAQLSEILQFSFHMVEAA